MNLLLQSVLAILLCIPVLAQQSFKPDLSKENIKKVHVHRVNSYGYSGGYIDTHNSNTGLVLVEFNKPTNYWAVYKFDLNEVIRTDFNLIEEYSKYLINPKKKTSEKIYRINGITINGDASLLDTLYTREVSKLDTLSYLRHIIDTTLHTGHGDKPEIFHYNHVIDFGDRIVYYIRSGKMIKSWEDSVLYRYGLVDDCNITLESGFHKLTLPTNGSSGSIDTLSIGKVIVDGLSYPSNDNVSSISTGKYNKDHTYDCVSGYLIFKNSVGVTYFASGNTIFQIDLSLTNLPQNDSIINLGNSFILFVNSGDSQKYKLYNNLNPKGKDISNLPSANIYNNLTSSCDGPWCATTRLNHTYVKTAMKQYILNLIDASTLEISPTWKLVKSLGGTVDTKEVKSKIIVNHFTKHAFYYTDKLVFKVPNEKFMIFGDGYFYELTKERMSNPENRESGDAP